MSCVRKSVCPSGVCPFVRIRTAIVMNNSQNGARQPTMWALWLTSHTSFPSVLKLVTLNDLERRYDYFMVFLPKAVGYRTNHVARPTLSATKWSWKFFLATYGDIRGRLPKTDASNKGNRLSKVKSNMNQYSAGSAKQCEMGLSWYHRQRSSAALL